MQVERKDGRCRECGGTLVIVGTDGATMAVECQKCGESYSVEPNALGDEALLYYVDVLTAPARDD